MPIRRITFTGSSIDVTATALDDGITATATVPLSKLHLDTATPGAAAAELALLLAFSMSPDLLDVTTDSSATMVVHSTFLNAVPGVDADILRTAIRAQVH